MTSGESSSAIDRFLELWVKQLSRTVQLFAGEQPAITWSRVRDLPPGEAEAAFWWKQALEGSTKFNVWIGAPEGTWNALGRASEDADTDDTKTAYLEILTKTQSATAAALSGFLSETLQCRKGQVSSVPKNHGLVYALIGVSISGEELPALIFAGEYGMRNALAELANFDEAQDRNKLISAQSGLMISRLLSLELPISVALGRTQVPIRELLKVVSGSVIELDQDVDDYADIIVHGNVVARGEIISVKGNYGIRIKEIVSQKDRIELRDRR